MLLNSDKWCCLGVSFEVYSASGGSGNEVVCSKKKFQKIHFPLVKIANLLQTRLEAIGSRLSEVQTKNFLWGFVKNTLVWHNAQGRGAEKQRWRERRADIRDF